MIFNLRWSFAFFEVGSEEIRRCAEAEQLTWDGADKEAQKGKEQAIKATNIAEQGHDVLDNSTGDINF